MFFFLKEGIFQEGLRQGYGILIKIIAQVRENALLFVSADKYIVLCHFPAKGISMYSQSISRCLLIVSGSFERLLYKIDFMHFQID